MAARERAAGAMDSDLMAATLQALPNGHSAGAAGAAQVRGYGQNAAAVMLCQQALLCFTVMRILQADVEGACPFAHRICIGSLLGVLADSCMVNELLANLKQDGMY